MSFINLVMTDQLISIISDGQITKNGIITESHFKKNLNQAPKAMSLALQDMKKNHQCNTKEIFFISQ